MRHTGTQHFTNLVVDQNADQFNTNILNKLSVPLHRPLLGTEFGDVFIESSALNVVDYDNQINALLDIGNPDIIKSLLLTEITFDEFFNFNKALGDSGSFHTLLDVNSEYVTQFTINAEYPVTTDQDQTSTPTINIQMPSNVEAETLFTQLLEINTYNLPLRVTFTDTTSEQSNNYMIYFDSLYYDSDNTLISIYLNSNNNITTLNDTTNKYIDKITINTYTIKNTLTVDNYIPLPKHYHELKDVSDMTNSTNIENGYIKLVDGNNIKLPFDYNIQIDRFKLNNSFFEKDQKENLSTKKEFIVNMNQTSFIDEVIYTDNTVQLGESVVVEYTFELLNLISTEEIQLTTNDNQEINRTKNFIISDTTEHENSYLVEYMKFDSNLLISPDNLGVSNIIDIYYEQVEKSIIDDPSLEIYTISNGIVTAINEYMDIQITQPNINTVPFTVIERLKLYKDDYGCILISLPEVHTDIIGTSHITFKNDSYIYPTFDSTTFPINITIFKLDLVSNAQEELSTWNLSDQGTKKTLPRGRYKFIADTILNKYTLKVFNV